MRKLKNQEQIMATWSRDRLKPLVSICCITYNHENFIEDAIQGFLIQQTDFPFEILIHDDASRDNTAGIISEYAEAYPKLIKPMFQTVNKLSQGIRPNEVYNLPRVQGRYIAHCEGDDYWTDPLKLQKSIDFLKNNPSYIGCGHCVEVIDENGKAKTFAPFGSYRGDLLTIEDQLKYNNIPTLSLIFENVWGSELVKVLGFLTAGCLYIGDYPLKCLLLSKGKIKIFEQKMGVYRFITSGSSSFSSQPLSTGMKDAFCFFRNLKTFFKGKTAILMQYHLAKSWLILLSALFKERSWKSLFDYSIQGLKECLLLSSLHVAMVSVISYVKRS